MNTQSSIKSTWSLRMLIWLGSALLSILFIWLIGFLLHDAGGFRKVDYDALRRAVVNADSEKKLAGMEAALAENNRQIATAEERAQFQRGMADNSRTTLDQMLELQKATLARGESISAEQQQALVEGQKSFLANQSAFETEEGKALELKSAKRQCEAEIAAVRSEIEAQKQIVDKKFRAETERRDLQAGFLKIAILMPMVIAAAWLFIGKRQSHLMPLILAFGVAVFWRLIWVIHEHFPTNYQKYIVIAVAIVVLIRLLTYLIRIASQPNPAQMLKRYREAYTSRKQECPVCGFPIQRASPTASQGVELQGKSGGHNVLIAMTGFDTGETPYTCPSCGTMLFETCRACGKVRHSLLPACRHCGAGANAPDAPASA